MPLPLRVSKAFVDAAPVPFLLPLGAALIAPAAASPGTRWTTYLCTSLGTALLATAIGAYSLLAEYQEHQHRRLRRDAAVGDAQAAATRPEAGTESEPTIAKAALPPAPDAAAVRRGVPYGVVAGLACLWIAGMIVYRVRAEGREGCWMRTQGPFANGMVVTAGWERSAC